MKQPKDLTIGSVRKTMLYFVLPYLLACFLQTFYGMADLFVVGLYNGSETTTAVSIGSQVMHMLTVMIVGLSMGATVEIGRSVGAKHWDVAAKSTGNAIAFFAALAAAATVILVALTMPIARVMMTPTQALTETGRYLRICFAGIPFIIAYNVIAAIFRGAGDSQSPMYFVAVACIVNLALDFVFIGVFSMGAAGAALGTVLGQAVSVLAALWRLRTRSLGFGLHRRDLRPERQTLSPMLKVGIPICMQDGLIQIAFIIITIIANSRGLVASAAVGIVEKVISFLFLVPSAFLSAISAITAQNMGAGKPERARESLRFGLAVTVTWGVVCCIACHLFPSQIVGAFTRDGAVIAAGSVYIMAYSFDCIFAAVHFCFSGYFCGDRKSGVSFVHNIVSILLCRIPGAYFASILFPATLYPMGLAAPAGSALSALICVGYYLYDRRKTKCNI